MPTKEQILSRYHKCADCEELTTGTRCRKHATIYANRPEELERRRKVGINNQIKSDICQIENVYSTLVYYSKRYDINPVLIVQIKDIIDEICVKIEGEIIV